MTLKKLINKSNWNDVKTELLKAYPDVETSISHFQKVYFELSQLNEVNCDLILYIRMVEVEKGKEFIAVSGIGEPNEFGNRYNISGQNWKEWLNMELHIKSLEDFTSSEIIAHSLYEMTFLGFTKSEIESKLNKLIM